MIFVSGIVIGFLLFAISWFGLRPMVTSLHSKKNYWTGNWYEIIPAQHGIDERIDFLSLTQIGQRVYGSAIRIYPVQEKKRTWHFEGFSSDNQIIGFFFLKNISIDPSSYIPTTLVRDKHPRTLMIWRGYYTWPAMSEDADIIAGQAKTGIVIWQKHKPDILSTSSQFVEV